MPTHPSKDIIGIDSSKLKNKNIILCVTGSVAAYKSIDIARNLMRHGAEIYPVMSEAAREIIHPNLLKWATGNEVVTELTGDIEHVLYAGKEGGLAHLILVAPATANTINKVANGICDTTVTTMVITAMGADIPIVFVPAMHEPLYTNPITRDSIKKLEGYGIEFIGPVFEEGKAKIADINTVTDNVIRLIGEPKNLVGKKVLILGGPTVEYIDPVRIITNKSSGKMGLALAIEAYYRGADVKLIMGPGGVDPPNYIDTVYVDTTEDMYRNTISELESIDYDYVIVAAAPSDFKPSETIPTKISTDDLRELNITLIPTQKIVEDIKRRFEDVYLIIFKAEYGIQKEELIERAYKKLIDTGADLVVANDVSKEGVGFRVDTNEVYIIDKEKNIVHTGLCRKIDIASKLYDIITK